MWGQIIGSLVGAGASLLGQRSANRANIRQAQQSQDFQREMSNTSYQRSMEDMKKAGLNPILAYQKGGASTPAGVTPQIKNELEGTASSAKDVALQLAQIKNIKATTEKEIMQTRVLKKDEGLRHVQGNQAIEQLNILRQNLSNAKSAATQAKVEDAFFKKYPWLKKIDIIGRSINPFSSTAKDVRGITKD